MQIGSADSTGKHLDKHIAIGRYGYVHIRQDKRFFRNWFTFVK
jgi:hypothetical protein